LITADHHLLNANIAANTMNENTLVVIMFALIIAATFLFQEDPDITDAIIHNLMKD